MDDDRNIVDDVQDIHEMMVVDDDDAYDDGDISLNDDDENRNGMVLELNVDWEMDVEKEN